jgi:four helix bundle protein
MLSDSRCATIGRSAFGSTLTPSLLRSSGSAGRRGSPLLRRYSISSRNRLLSVQLNIAEGYTYGNSRTFTRHLGIAYGSAVETGELLRLAVEADLLEAKVVAPLLERNQQSEHILLALLKQRRNFRA